MADNLNEIRNDLLTFDTDEDSLFELVNILLDLVNEIQSIKHDVDKLKENAMDSEKLKNLSDAQAKTIGIWSGHDSVFKGLIPDELLDHPKVIAIANKIKAESKRIIEEERENSDEM